jgi:hypothetical protein
VPASFLTFSPVSLTNDKDFAYLKQAHSPVREGEVLDSHIGETDFCRYQDEYHDDIEPILLQVNWEKRILAGKW